MTKTADHITFSRSSNRAFVWLFLLLFFYSAKADFPSDSALLNSFVADTNITLAESAMKQKDYANAISYFEKTTFHNLSAEQLNNYGVCLLEIGEYTESATVLQQAAEKSNNEKIVYNLGLALFKSKQFSAARNYFALQNDSLSLYFTAKSFEAENELNSALKAYQQFQKTNTSIDVTREIRLLHVTIFISKNWYYLLAALVFTVILLISFLKRKE